MRIFNGFLAVVVALLYSGICVADAALETQVGSMQKTYINGNTISLNCPKNPGGACELQTVVGRHKIDTVVDFNSVGLEVLMNTIALYVLSEEDDIFAVQVGVKCRNSDYASFKPDYNAIPDCYATFEVDEEGLKWKSINIYAVKNVNIYNKIMSKSDSE